MNKIKVLFLCTGNSARSQVAEALLREYAGDHFDVYSAGLEPKGIHPYTRQVMHEMGIDLSGQRSKHLNEYIGKLRFEHLITVCGNAEQACPTFPGAGRRQHWPFDDPAAVEGSEEHKLAAFREVRDQIGRRVRAWLAEQGISVGTGEKNGRDA
jgi:arsenate reductase